VAARVDPEVLDPAAPQAAVPASELDAPRPEPVASSGFSFTRSRWTLVAILLFAFILRAWNLDWDRGTHLHPDERFWSDVAANVERPDVWEWDIVLDPEVSPLNPRVHKPNYVYGTLPLWASEAAAGVLMTDQMTWAVAAIDSVGIDVARAEPAEAPINERLRFNTGFDVTIIGRLMSALVDTATVGVVYLLAVQLSRRRREGGDVEGPDRQVGLLAAFLQALTVLHIQYSHFLGSEPWVALFVTIVVWGSVKLAQGRGGWRTRVITAVALGFAIGSKLNGVAAVVAPVVAVLIAVWPEVSEALRGRGQRGWFGRSMRKLDAWLVMAIVAIAAYRLAQPYDFESGISLIFNDRFQSDVEYLQDINQGGNWPWVQPLVGATPLLHPLKQVFLWGMGPGLALAAIFGIVRAIQRFFAGERVWAIPLAVIGAYLVLVSFQFYAIIRYLQPAYPTMVALAAIGLVAAWRWAAAAEIDQRKIARVAQGAVVLSVAATTFWGLAFVNGVYNQDNARLAAGDWMLENLPAESVVSQQEWDDGLPWGQPSPFGRVTLKPFSFGGDTPEHIELLIDGLDQVDYVIETSNKFYDALPRTPARFPQMTEYYEVLFDGSLGFELIETFSNPPSLFGITIDDSNAEEAFTLYDHPTVFIWQKTDDFSVQRAYELLNPDRARTAVNAIPGDAYANASMLTPAAYETQQTGSSFSDVHSANPGSLVAAVSWFVIMQLAALAVAPTLMLHAGRSAGAVWGLTKILGLIVLGLPVWLLVSWGWFEFSSGLVWAALLALALGGLVTAVRSADRLEALWRTHRRTILTAEAVFVTIFLAVLALRAANPDLWHPWRGGEKPMELAYFTAVTGSTTFPPYDPWLAGGSLNYYYFGWFLLSVPTRILGIQPDVAFNLGVATYAAIAAATVFSTTAMLTDLAGRSRSVRLSPHTTGLLASLMFLVIGNLDALRQVITRLREGLPLSDFDWWDPSRVNKNSSGFEVTEFPSFTVLFADLHPHFMAMGIFGLGLAGCIALIERTRQGATRTSWMLVIGLGIGSGIMRMTHTWDLPTFGLAAAGAVVLGAIAADGPTWWRTRTAVAQLVTLAAAHMIVTAPYRGANQVADSGFHRSESTTNLDDWIAHWGLFLFIAIAYLALRLFQLRDRLVQGVATSTAMLIVAGIGWLALHRVVGSVAAWAFLGLMAAVLVLWGEILTDRIETAHVMTAAMWALGFAVLTGVESFTQNADIQRLNTVFKFWLQVWHLFAVAGAFAAMWVLYSLRLAVSAVERPSLRLRFGRRVFAGGLVVLLVVSMLYPLLSFRPRSANRIDTTLGPSLQGQLWLEPGTTTFGIKDAFENEFFIDPGLDRPVIEWLQANVEGRPTIVEAVGGAEYQWWGRISINTGLPTVLGWRWHQDQQRTLFNYEVNERKRDVASFFVLTSVAEIDKFLRAYDVSYIVIGSVEAAIADPETLRIFAEHPSLEAVFQRGDQVIYEVEKRTLAQRSANEFALGAD
jgi:YYY domain-containing protein